MKTPSRTKRILLQDIKIQSIPDIPDEITLAQDQSQDMVDGETEDNIYRPSGEGLISSLHELSLINDGGLTAF